MERREVAETLEAGSIVVVNEAIEKGISIGVREEAPVSGATFRFPANGVADAAVEALDETIGLRPVGSGETVVDLALGAKTIEGMSTGRSVVRLVLHVDGEAIGELTAIVGEDRVNAMWEVGEEAFEEAGGGIGIASGVDLQVDVAGRPIDGDKGVALASLQSRQMLEIDMNEADRGMFEDADRRLAGSGPLVQPMPLKTAVGGTTGDLGIDAAPHHFGDVIERQLQLRAQLANQRFFQRRELGRQPLRRVRSVGHRRSTAPTINRRLAHPQLDGKLCNRLLAALDISADLGGRGGIGVQVQLHNPRRSLIYEMPRSTPIPSNQSPETEHESGGGVAPLAFTYSVVKQPCAFRRVNKSCSGKRISAPVLLLGAGIRPTSSLLPSPSGEGVGAPTRRMIQVRLVSSPGSVRECVAPGRARIAGLWA